MHWWKHGRLWIGYSLDDCIGYNWPDYFLDSHNFIYEGPARRKPFWWLGLGIIEIRYYDKENWMLKLCPNCKPHEYQDRRYGKNVRVMNVSGSGTKVTCTVCGTQYSLSGNEIEKNKKREKGD